MEPLQPPLEEREMEPLQPPLEERGMEPLPPPLEERHVRRDGLHLALLRAADLAEE